MRVALVVTLLAASVALTVYSLTGVDFYVSREWRERDLLAVTIALWALFALAVLALRRVPDRAVVPLVVAGALAIGLGALAGPPNTSTDSARYAWDGIVQKAGVSPYDHVPASSALEELRPDWLFPAPDASGDCSGERIMTARDADGDTVCTAINRANVPTIYPPMAELYFLGVRLLVPAEAEYWPLQIGGLLISLGVTALLLRVVRRTGRDPRWVALWAWSPFVATEAVTNSHVDALGALLLVAATMLVASRHPWLGGIAFGAGVAVKLVPAVAGPSLVRRRWWAVAVASVATFAVLYVPYVLTSGIEVLGYLPGYLTEEGYESGERFLLASAVLPGDAATVLVALVVLVTAALVLWKTNPDDPWLAQLVMIGVTLLAVSPRYPWYALLLIPAIVVTGRWEWYAVAAALTLRLLVPINDVARVSLAVAAMFVVVMAVRRLGPEGRARLRRPALLRRSLRRR
ncbi:glycosyltransferase family 87 protein [Desertivibrio insolitus]|uniref:glycosyltransferase family 87 protein n=1 Tax=Herbiconiux sp. SYSU D00978 TaxID=2812562 RepID=UPI001A9608D9|nr:glycosyltransferase family 87 protein [Herbiconiux sp. SYSU D00978]